MRRIGEILAATEGRYALTLAVALAAFLLQPASATWAKDLVRNGSFLADRHNWTDIEGSWVRVVDGAPTDPTGSVGAIETTTADASQAPLIGQCIPVGDLPPGQEFTYAAFGNAVNHTQLLIIQVRFFTSLDCSGGATGEATSGFPSPPMNTWIRLGAGTELPAGTLSMLLELGPSAGVGSAVTRFDYVRAFPSQSRGFHFTDPSAFSEWTPQGSGSWMQDPNMGIGLPQGTARGEIDTLGAEATTSISQCVDVSTFNAASGGQARYGCGVFMFAVDPVSDTQVTWEFFSDTACLGSSLGVGGGNLGPVPTGQWISFEPGLLGGCGVDGANSIRTLLAFTGTDGQQLHFETPWIIWAEGVLFWDTFETGTTSAWSAAVP